MRRILVVTGIRSEYFLARPILQAIVDHPALTLQLVVTGAHLSPLHGYSVHAVENDGFPILERIESLLYSDRDAARVKGAATQLQLLAHIIDRERPDWLLALGDREEALVLATCGAYMNIPVAHYAAGDRVVGNVDDMVRHAVSRLAHLLLTVSEPSRERLIASGEEAWRVHFVGHSGIDRLRTTRTLLAAELAAALGIPKMPSRYAVVVQHSLSSEISRAGEQMEHTLSAVRAAGLPAFVSYPNSDAGHAQIIAAIERARAGDGIVAFRNLPDEVFVNLLRGAAVLVGNSSAGVMEAPYLKLPALNIGNRQSGRTHAENFFLVSDDEASITGQLRKILEDPSVAEQVRNCKNPFGDGHAAEKVANLLAETPINGKLLNKDLTL